MDDADERLAKLLAKALKAFIADGYRRGQEDMRARAAETARHRGWLGRARERVDAYTEGERDCADKLEFSIAALPIKEFGE